MWRNTAKFSFSIIGARETKPHIQLPLLSYQEVDHSLQYRHQITSLSFQTHKKIKLTRLQQIAQFIQQKQLQIDLSSSYLLAWNVVVLLVVFTLFVEIPIVVFAPKGLYEELYYNTAYIVFYYLMMIILIIDTFAVRPRICYQIKGHKIETTAQAIRYYTGKSFKVDVLSLLILIISNLPFHNIDYLRLFFLIKIFSLKDVDRQIEAYLLASPIAQGTYSFIRLTSFIVFVTNLYACIYFAIDYHYYIKKAEFYNMGYLWLNGSSAVGEIDIFTTFGWSGSYIYALFWALQTSRTCGYGVATPKNTVQIFYVNFVILTLVVIFVYFANGVIKIVLEYSSSMRKKESAVFALLKNIEHYQIDEKIRDKMKEYFSNYKNFENEELENNIIGSLSEDLRNRYTFAFNMYFIDLISVFNLLSPYQNAEQRLLKLQISKKIQKKSYDTKQILFDTFSISQPSIILIQKGTIIIQNQHIKYHRIQQQWSLIGQRQFYYDKLPIYRASANEYSQISFLNRSDFLEIIKKYRSFYEKLRQIMDKIILRKKDTTLLQTKCIFCDDSHLQQFCPSHNQWRYDIRFKRLKKLQNLSDHERHPKPRKSVKTLRTILLHKKDIQLDKIKQAISYNNHFNL